MIRLIFLALIQSLTEFLPISSSGHLLLAQFLGLVPENIVVDVALHVGTLLAVIVYFWHDILEMISFKNLRLGLQLAVATIPVAVVGLLCHTWIESAIRLPWVVGICAIFFGWLLWRVDDFRPCHRKIDQMDYREALYIGLAQVLALIPGTSRSGITMTAARWLGFKREESARFSMLLSIPTIAMAGLYMGWRVCHGQMIIPPVPELSLAVMASAIFGVMAIAFLMKWLQKASFLVFALYRIILGVFLILYFW